MVSPHRELPTVSCLTLVLLLLAGTSTGARPADALFGGRLTGSQVVPATASTGSAEARLLLNNAGSALLVGRFLGLGSACTAVHVHVGAPGANGPVFAVSSCPATTAGDFLSTVGGTPAEIAIVRSGLWYVDIHTTSLPDGEVRTQLLPIAAHTANLTGAQVVPTPTGVTASGFALATLDAAGTGLDITVSYDNLPGGTTGIDLHEGLPGANGPVMIPLLGPCPVSDCAFSWLYPVTPTQAAAFKAGRLYVTVRTAAFPQGALRGQLKPPDKPFDFDADGRAEVGVFRPGTGVWYTINQGTGVVRSQAWGASGDQPTAADYDGDGKIDLAIWRSGVFWINVSSTGGLRVQPWGTAATDQPVAPGDFDGDGRTDPAIYRYAATSVGPQFYYILQSVDNTPRIHNWGITNDVDISADYDGDRRTDPAIYRISSSTYYILGSTAGMMVRTWGVFATDRLSPGDYDGDGQIDVAVFRFNGPGAGTWYVLKSSTLTLEVTSFGSAGDFPVPGDYDGDGRTDKAVVRSSGGALVWYILRSSTGTMDVRTFGLNSDYPIPATIVR